MKRLPVMVSPTVVRQVEEIVEYIALDSVDNALSWERRMRTALTKLGEVHFHAVDEDASARVGRTIRKTVFERTYLIHYCVSNDQVEVLNVRHGARLPRGGEP